MMLEDLTRTQSTSSDDDEEEKGVVVEEEDEEVVVVNAKRSLRITNVAILLFESYNFQSSWWSCSRIQPVGSKMKRAADHPPRFETMSDEVEEAVVVKDFVIGV